jgi:hypothetical protein
MAVIVFVQLRQKDLFRPKEAIRSDKKAFLKEEEIDFSIIRAYAVYREEWMGYWYFAILKAARMSEVTALSETAPRSEATRMSEVTAFSEAARLSEVTRTSEAAPFSEATASSEATPLSEAAPPSEATPLSEAARLSEDTLSSEDTLLSEYFYIRIVPGRTYPRPIRC